MKDDHVKPQGSEMRNSPKVRDKAGHGNEAALTGHEACYWNDKKYSDGATVCDSHTRYECWSGKWLEIGLC